MKKNVYSLIWNEYKSTRCSVNTFGNCRAAQLLPQYSFLDYSTCDKHGFPNCFQWGRNQYSKVFMRRFCASNSSFTLLFIFNVFPQKEKVILQISLIVSFLSYFKRSHLWYYSNRFIHDALNKLSVFFCETENVQSLPVAAVSFAIDILYNWKDKPTKLQLHVSVCVYAFE